MGSWQEILIGLGRALLSALNAIFNPVAKYTARATAKLEALDYEAKTKGLEALRMKMNMGSMNVKEEKKEDETDE